MSRPPIVPVTQTGSSRGAGQVQQQAHGEEQEERDSRVRRRPLRRRGSRAHHPRLSRRGAEDREEGSQDAGWQEVRSDVNASTLRPRDGESSLVGVFGGFDAPARLAAAQFYLRGCNATQLGRFTLCQTRHVPRDKHATRPDRFTLTLTPHQIRLCLSNKHPLISGGYGRAPPRRLPQFVPASFPSVAVSLRRHTGHESLVLSHSRMHDSP